MLDLLDTFIKKQPTSPLIPRLILPLVELVVNAGTDEKQLADKATGILRSRIGKSKDTPSSIDADQMGEVLSELHVRARKAVSGDVLSTLSQCSLYLSRSLIHAHSDTAVLEAYRGSLTDFVSRKASRFNANFFQEFIRRHPSVAWGLRGTLLDLTEKAVNGYRQSQVFQLIQTLLSQPPATVRVMSSILKFVLTCAIGRSDNGCIGVYACSATKHTESHPKCLRRRNVDRSSCQRSSETDIIGCAPNETLSRVTEGRASHLGAFKLDIAGQCTW